ncbi:metal ABC transporter permease, partial [Staphylococcus aureus]
LFLSYYLLFYFTLSPALAIINPMWFGILFAVIGALLIEKLRTSYSNYQEIAIPIIMSAGIALSAIFISLADGFNQEIVGLLFGSISAVNLSDLTTIIIILFLSYYLLFYFTLSPALAIINPMWFGILFAVI